MIRASEDDQAATRGEDGEIDLTAEERRAARGRRERLHRALVELEEALTSPAASDRWLPTVRSAVHEMRETIHDHVAESEGPEGLLAQVSEVSPWLGPRVEQLRDEHDGLASLADQLVYLLDDAHAADVVADAAWSLLDQVSRHRRRGADLLYDAYALDVSAGD